MPVSNAVHNAVRERCKGDGTVELCEDCRGYGYVFGLSFHEWPPKGMGGTKHNYTEDEVWRLCYPCHRYKQEHHNRRGGE